MEGSSLSNNNKRMVGKLNFVKYIAKRPRPNGKGPQRKPASASADADGGVEGGEKKKKRSMKEAKEIVAPETEMRLPIKCECGTNYLFKDRNALIKLNPDGSEIPPSGTSSTILFASFYCTSCGQPFKISFGNKPYRCGLLPDR